MTSHDDNWCEYVLADGSPVLAKRCESRAKNMETIVVAAHQDNELIGLYPYQGESVANVLRHPPLRVMREYEITIQNLDKILFRPDVERVLGEINAAPFYDVCPASRYLQEIIQKITEVRLPGWIYTTMSSRGIAMLKDFGTFGAESYHAVGITDIGVAVYKGSIKNGGSLYADDQIFYMATEHIDVDALAKISCWPDAIEICEVHNSLRRWIYQAALAKS